MHFLEMNYKLISNFNLPVCLDVTITKYTVGKLFPETFLSIPLHAEMSLCHFIWFFTYNDCSNIVFNGGS